MEKNDMAVQSDALTAYAYSVEKKVALLQSLCAAMRNNISVAARDFEGDNFFRAAEIISNMLQKLAAANDKIHHLKHYLEQLQDLVGEYFKIRGDL